MPFLIYRNMTQPNNSHDQQLYILSELLALSERCTAATLDEMRFISVNETHKLIPYEQAGLWENINETKAQLTALSGAPIIDKKSPYPDFLKRLYATHAPSMIETTKVDAAESPLAEEWLNHLARHVTVLPLRDNEGQHKATLFFAKAAPWQDDEIALLERLAPIYGAQLGQKQKSAKHIGARFNTFRKSKKKYWLLAAAVFVLLYPLPSSVLAPAEIIAKDPALIRAPLEGIISDIAVTPNQSVSEGALLFSYDLDTFTAQKELSEKALSVAQRELRQATQEALNDPRARARLASLKGRVEKEQTNLAYYKSVVERGKVYATSQGTVIFEDIYDWVGRPVAVGERIMLLAQPDHTELEIHLHANEAIALNRERPLLFFSDARPDIPLKATLSYHSYKANQNEQGDIAYRLKADWIDVKAHQELYRLGHKGTVKLYGPNTLLILQILRKPIIFMRKIIGI